MSNKILIIGGGGREHALAWKLKQSPKVDKIFIAPGNAGTAEIGTNVDIKATDVLALADWAQNNQIDFTVVGPDDALGLGIVDEFQKRNLKIWGPSKAAAQIESSKAFAKELMKKNNIPTAKFKTFKDYEDALNYINDHFAHVGAGFKPAPTGIQKPIVIKASGLALGKGVTICKTLDEAKTALKEAMVDKIFGDSGNQVVIEEFLEGPEFSIHAFCDGKNFQLLPSAQDHKAIFNGGLGPNTGGMGTIAPVPWVTQTMLDEISSTIIKPILEGLVKEGCLFVGLLYPGLMLTKDGPKVIEFNCRFGDPETQSLMRLLKTDLFDILTACVDKKISDIKIEWNKKSVCCIALASGGYPGKYEKGKTITGVKEAESLDDIIVFHAGTATSPGLRPPSPHKGRDGERLVTNGGRVLGVTAIADDLQSALNIAYAAVKLINFDGMHYRKDIGEKSLC